jgi:hypothetical protein
MVPLLPSALLVSPARALARENIPQVGVKEADHSALVGSSRWTQEAWLGFSALRQAHPRLSGLLFFIVKQACWTLSSG